MVTKDPKFRIAYSPYFAQYIMCVRYESDDNWSFVLLDARKQPCSRIMKARSKHSSFNWNI
jgi:hypothetical protein